MTLIMAALHLALISLHAHSLTAFTGTIYCGGRPLFLPKDLFRAATIRKLIKQKMNRQSSFLLQKCPKICWLQLLRRENLIFKGSDNQ